MDNKINTMINPPIIELLDKSDNRYSLIIATSRRARQLIDGASPLIDTISAKPLTISIDEINEDAYIIEKKQEA